jgi:RHS repeat-associated protein
VRNPAGTLTTYYHDQAGLLIALLRDATWYYVASDQLGTPRVVTDATGITVKVMEYDSFGVKTADSNPGFDLSIGYAGGLADPATGMVRFGFRDYEAAAGRWSAKDPILFSGGQGNLYVYVSNNPANLIDPSGLFCIGGSAYALAGAGFKACIDEDGVSACAEVGFGVGGGTDVDLFGKIDRNSSTVGAAAKVTAAGISVGLEGKLDDCGNLTGGPTCSLLGVSCGGKLAFGDAPFIEILAEGAKVKAEAKIFAEACRNAKF